MTYVIQLDLHREIETINSDINVHRKGQELQFKYAGLSNDPISERYILFTTKFNFESRAVLLGDGFQMLAQTTGTAENPEDVGRCPDDSASYRIYSSQEPKRYYNYLVVEEPEGYTLFGFSSCHRFAGYFDIVEEDDGLYLYANIDGEDTRPQDWDSNDLESVLVVTGETLSEVYREYSHYLKLNHPPRLNVTGATPVGWCSWYAYYADVTRTQVEQNLQLMTDDLDDLEYVLIDDGYQAFMGDWLDPSDKFAEGVKSLIKDIICRGKKPAIWIAPFIAQRESKVFRQNPDWFIKNDRGQPMTADEVTYGGWRCTPWYLLDTSHPEVIEHLSETVRTMREEWGVELFKMDANYWGALKGKRYQRGITGVEAYRLGLKAIAEGAGDAFLLGCNSPMWPSLGLVDGMRVSDDVERHPHRFAQIAKETFYRSWQHLNLWQIDPDCATFVSLPNQTTNREAYDFHRTALLASSGLLLSGDPLPDLTMLARSNLAKLLLRGRRSQQAARFSSLSMTHGQVKLTDKNDLHCVFNYFGDEQEITLRSDRPVHWYDYWTGQKLSGEASTVMTVKLAEGLTSRAVLTAP